MGITEIEQALKRFFEKHRDETFYVIAIDAGYLYLSSEEQFEQRRKRSSADWVERMKPAARAKQREAGNPYEKPGSHEWTRLREGTGNFGYQQAVDLGLDDEYQEHYEADQPATSTYARKVATILGELEAAKSRLLADVKVSQDFKIYAVDHEL